MLNIFILLIYPGEFMSLENQGGKIGYCSSKVKWMFLLNQSTLWMGDSSNVKHSSLKQSSNLVCCPSACSKGIRCIPCNPQEREQLQSLKGAVLIGRYKKHWWLHQSFLLSMCLLKAKCSRCLIKALCLDALKTLSTLIVRLRIMHLSRALTNLILSDRVYAKSTILWLPMQIQ